MSIISEFFNVKKLIVLPRAKMLLGSLSNRVFAVILAYRATLSIQESPHHLTVSRFLEYSGVFVFLRFKR